MSGRDVHGEDWRDEWDDPRWARGSGNVYGCGFWAIAILAILLFLGVWLFSPPVRASDWRQVPISRCVGPAMVALILGDGLRIRLRSNGVSEYRRRGARAVVQLRWCERGRCLDTWRAIEERKNVMQNLEKAMMYRPTLAERFWRRLGFRHHHGDLPDDLDERRFPGWMKTRIFLRFSMMDRLRLLLTGRLRLELEQRPSTQVDECASATSWKILPPGEEWSA